MVDNIPNNTEFHKVTISPYEGTEYARLDFDDASGVTMGSIVAHRLSNPKVRNIDGVDHLVQYHHNHITIYSTTDDQGSTKGVIDITHGKQMNQIQIEADLVQKDRNGKIILQSTGGKFFELRVQDDGSLTTIPVDRSYIEYTNDSWVDLGTV